MMLNDIFISSENVCVTAASGNCEQQDKVAANDNDNEAETSKIEARAAQERKLIFEQLEIIKDLTYKVQDPCNLSDICQCLRNIAVKIESGGKISFPALPTPLPKSAFDPKTQSSESSAWLRSTRNMYCPLPSWKSRRRGRRSIRSVLGRFAGNCGVILTFVLS